MSLSIITPHYNNFEGLYNIYQCLKKQSCKDWEWIIVDDFSDQEIQTKLSSWYEEINKSYVRLILNTNKTNASVCRNLGVEHSKYEGLIFLDSDDYINPEFVKNRLISVNEFIVFKNYYSVIDTGEIVNSSRKFSNPLDSFLSAHFVWQTTCVLWNKQFLINLGQFDPNLERLQDVELSIRALLFGKDYEIVNNEIDFYYTAKPIRLKENIVEKSCISVNYLIKKLHNNNILSNEQRVLIKSYYFACVKGLSRTKNKLNTKHLNKSILLFYKLSFINFWQFICGYTLLILFRFQLISNTYFLKLNRRLFKRVTSN